MVHFKDATVQQVASWNGDQNHWNIIFLRSPNDWEEESVLNLFALLAKGLFVSLVNDYLPTSIHFNQFHQTLIKNSSFLQLQPISTNFYLHQSISITHR